MAVFTAAVLAVTAATTMATVATAVVAVSTAIAVAGTVVGVIGMAIGNEDLMFAGKIMGYVGLAGGLIGGAIGGLGAIAGGTGTFLEGAQAAYSGAAAHLQEAWNTGVGSLFSSNTGAVVANGPQAGASGAPAGAPAGASASAGSPAATSTPGGPPTGAVGTHSLPNAGVPASTASPAVPVAPGSSVTTVQVPGAPTNFLVNAPAAPAGATEAGGFLSSMPEWAKYSMMTTAGQGLAGSASGLFAGSSKEEELALQNKALEQEQRQRDWYNRNNSYAPLIRFAPQQTGLINWRPTS